MTTTWEEIQTINNLEQGYQASIADLRKKEPSFFSFIQDFTRPFLPKTKQQHIAISSATLQEEIFTKSS